jgi:hypothetical protein
LWTAVAEATGARGNTTALVGTPEQVADALLDYYDLGITTFLIRGFDPWEDAIAYGKSLLPVTRALVLSACVIRRWLPNRPAIESTVASLTSKEAWSTCDQTR